MAGRAFLIFTFILSSVFGLWGVPKVSSADSPLLTAEENLWLTLRNNTIVVYPEKNNPPFSYQSASGIIQGLSIDYMELIADKIGAKIEYLTPRARSQILSDISEGKGDVIVSLSSSPERETSLLFTESYITVPVVIVVRKDAEVRSNLTLNDFTGKRVAMVEGSAIQEYIRQNYPRVVREGVTDDEVGLQQVVLGEVEAVVMDVASLSYLLSKQILSSIKVAGSTGFDYQPAFAIAMDRAPLQSIIEKGLMQISVAERDMMAEKWVVLPGEEKEQGGLLQRITGSQGVIILYFLFGMVVIGLAMVIFRHRHSPFRGFGKAKALTQLEDEMVELEGASKVLSKELEEVKEMEHNIQEKINELKG